MRIPCLAMLALSALPLHSAAAQAPTPGARAGYALGFDSSLGEVVLFGGETPSGLAGDLWSWNGARWRRLDAGTAGPGGRDDAAMAFDRTRRRLVLHGGRARGAQGLRVFTDTWEWNGTRWTLADTAGVGARVHRDLVYDPDAERVLLIGGASAAGPDRLFQDIHTWSGTAWDRGADTLMPGVLFIGAARLRAGLHALTVNLAAPAPGGLYAVDVLRWSGTRWERAESRGAPAISPKPPVAPGPVDGTIVLFDGYPPGEPRVPATWLWQGGAWTRIAGPQPPARRGASMVLDERRRVVVLVGGDDGSRLLEDVWEFDGRQWRAVPPR